MSSLRRHFGACSSIDDPAWEAGTLLFANDAAIVPPASANESNDMVAFDDNDATRDRSMTA